MATSQVFDFDRRLQLPNNFLFVGATQSGKTSLFFKALEKTVDNFFPPPKHLLFLYSCYQPGYLEISQKLIEQGVRAKFIQASQIEEDDLKKLYEENRGEQTIVAIDDATMSSIKSPKLANLFTIARHYQCSMVLFWHTLFGGTNPSRVISQNTSYFFLLSSPRLKFQVGTLGGQLGSRKIVEWAYREVTKQRYGYILIDTTVRCPDFLRIRSHVMSQDPTHYVYVSSV